MKARSAQSFAFVSATLLLSACGSTSDSKSSAGTGGGTSSGETPTWHADIAPLVAQHCQSCHTDGGISPFSLQTYAQAKMWSSSFNQVLRSGVMPPFLARDAADCKPRFGFKDDLRLSTDQIDLFKRWNDAGCPEGDPSTAATVPSPPELELKDAEVSVTIPAPVTIEGAGDKFVCFSLAPDLSPLAATGPEAALLGDRVLIDGAQVHPGNSAIVHHVLVYTDASGQSAALAGDKGYYDCFGGPKLNQPSLVLAWAPGATPVTAPQGVAMALPSKGRLVMQVHYHPTGKPETDSATSLQLRGYHAGIPTYISTLKLVGNAKTAAKGLLAGPDDTTVPEFRIPAGAQNHTESMAFDIPAGTPEYRVWTVGTHMHYVGTDMRIGIKRAVPGDQPAEECLLDTPSWDFNWQRGYRYDVAIEQAPTATAGDQLTLRCAYDNSMANPHVASALVQQGLTAPRDVVLGEETLDEMCLGVFGVAQKVSDLAK